MNRRRQAYSHVIVLLLDVVARGVPPVFVDGVQVRCECREVELQEKAEHDVGTKRAAIAHGGVERKQRRQHGVGLALKQHVCLVSINGRDVVLLCIHREETNEDQKRLLLGEVIVEEKQ